MSRLNYVPAFHALREHVPRRSACDFNGITIDTRAIRWSCVGKTHFFVYYKWMGQKSVIGNTRTARCFFSTEMTLSSGVSSNVLPVENFWKRFDLHVVEAYTLAFNFLMVWTAMEFIRRTSSVFWYIETMERLPKLLVFVIIRIYNGIQKSHPVSHSPSPEDFMVVLDNLMLINSETFF